jgi:hypothetical protein
MSNVRTWTFGAVAFGALMIGALVSTGAISFAQSLTISPTPTRLRRRRRLPPRSRPPPQWARLLIGNHCAVSDDSSDESRYWQFGQLPEHVRNQLLETGGAVRGDKVKISRYVEAMRQP